MVADPPHRPAINLLREAIDLIIVPSIHYPSLVKGLEILAHIAMIASKLREEITRILVVNEGDHDPADLPTATLVGIQREVEKLEAHLWQVSLELRRLHVARSLGTRGINMKKLGSLIKCYFSDPEPHRAGSSDRKPNIHENLFISAMPDAFINDFRRFGDEARDWHALALSQQGHNTEKYGSAPWAEAGAMDTRAIIARIQRSTSRVFELVNQVESIITGETTATPASTSKRETRTTPSLSPELERVTKLPRLSYAQVSNKKPQRRSIGRASLTPSTSTSKSVTISHAKVHFDPLTLEHRTTSMMETEAMLVVSRDSSVELSGSGPMGRIDKGKAKAPEEVKPRGARTATAKPQLRPQKRPRASFPPREGPDYTRPLPTASATVKGSRLHSFQTKDIHR